jgi:FkbM family methyltransferase
MPKSSYRIKLWQMIVLKLRGRIRHHDRFGLSYWLWENTRALAIPYNHPGTDDTGVLEQITRIYKITDVSSTDRSVSIDVGAHIGIISLAMSKYGGANHRIHSFEADGLNFDMFGENLASNQPHSIHTHRTAVGGQVGTAQFTRTSIAGANHLGTDTISSDPGAIVFDVPVTTLDAFAEQQDFDVIKLLKIDAEGVDIEVLRGAKKLLTDNRIESIIVEIPLTVKGRSEMIEFLGRHEMTTAYIERNTDQLSPATEEIYNGSARAPLNMLAVRSDMANKLIS